MPNLLIWIVTVIYLGQAIVYCLEDKPWLGLVFAGYAMANVGLAIGT